MESPTAMTDIIWTRYDPAYGSKREGSYQARIHDKYWYKLVE